MDVPKIAQAVSALINSAPRSPRVEEIEAVVRQHMPELPQASDGEWYVLMPKAAAGELHSLGQRKMRLGGRPILDPQAMRDLADYGSDENAIIIYAHPLLLIDPRDDERKANGILIRPRRLYIVWYDNENNAIRLMHLSPWGAVESILPQQFSGLMNAWEDVRSGRP